MFKKKTTQQVNVENKYFKFYIYSVFMNTMYSLFIGSSCNKCNVGIIVETQN